MSTSSQHPFFYESEGNALPQEHLLAPTRFEDFSQIPTGAFSSKTRSSSLQSALTTQMTQTDHRILALKIPEVFVAFHYQLE